MDPNIFTYANWVKTRERYLDWISQFLTESKYDTSFQWRGFNLWYITKPAGKDVEMEKEWFTLLHKRLNGVSVSSKNKSMSFYEFLLAYILLFIYDIFKTVLCKYWLGKSFRDINADVYFHSLSNNINTYQGQALDRHFAKGPLEDIVFGKKAAYVVLAQPGKNNIKQFFTYRRKFRENMNLLGRPWVLLNKYASLMDIWDVYSTLFRVWVNFRKISKDESFRNKFQIDDVQCADIILREIEKSFLGEIQWALLYGLCFSKWIASNSIKKPIVTYGETLSPIRAVYHFSKQVDPSVLFYSIQHSINNKNKLGFYHRQAEFLKDQQPNFSVLPDYYLVQGDQFRQIAKEFYPEGRIKIVGCLKYDDMVISRQDFLEKGKYVSKKMGKTNGKVILLAPSVNDISSLISLFSNPIFAPLRILLCPHPATNKQLVRELVQKVGNGVKIEVVEGFRTVELFPIANLVVCGYSASCYEALIFGVPAIQFAETNHMPLVEPIPEIPFFSEREEFWKWFTQTKIGDVTSIELDAVIKKYFYRIDGRSSNRLWQSIIETA